MHVALTELEKAYDYRRGSATEKEAVEAACFLRLGATYTNIAPVLARFGNPHSAMLEMVRFNPLLPSSMASVPLVTRMAALNDRLAGATWASCPWRTRCSRNG